jgi:hypothetical protein
MGGTSSKTAFTQLANSLLEKDVNAGDHEFWDELWRTVLSVEEMFEILPADDIRKMIHEKPENVKTVFTQAVAQLYQVVETPYPIYFQQALNCARVLTRLLPFLIESPEQMMKDLLWNKRLVKSIQHQAVAPKADGEEQKEPQTLASASGDEYQESEPLGVILVNTVFHLLFLPDFTIEDPNVEFSENDVDSPAFKQALIWNDRTVTASSPYDINRVEVLRLMLATFCDSLYQHADRYDSCASLWLEVATSVDAPYAEIIFHSLLNSVLGKENFFVYFSVLLSRLTCFFLVLIRI